MWVPTINRYRVGYRNLVEGVSNLLPPYSFPITSNVFVKTKVPGQWKSMAKWGGGKVTGYVYKYWTVWDIFRTWKHACLCWLRFGEFFLNKRFGRKSNSNGIWLKFYLSVFAKLLVSLRMNFSWVMYRKRAGFMMILVDQGLN